MPALPGPWRLSHHFGKEIKVSLQNFVGTQWCCEFFQVQTVSATKVWAQQCQSNGGAVGECLLDHASADMEATPHEVNRRVVTHGCRVVTETDNSVLTFKCLLESAQKRSRFICEEVTPACELGFALAVDDAHVSPGVGGHGRGFFCGRNAPGGDAGLAQHNAECVVVVRVVRQDKSALFAQAFQDFGLVCLHVLLHPGSIHAVVVKNAAGKEAVAGQPLLAEAVGNLWADSEGVRVGLGQSGQVGFVR